MLSTVTVSAAVERKALALATSTSFACSALTACRAAASEGIVSRKANRTLAAEAYGKTRKVQGIQLIAVFRGLMVEVEEGEEQDIGIRRKRKIDDVNDFREAMSARDAKQQRMDAEYPKPVD